MSFGKMAPSLETGGSGKSIIKVWTKQTTIGQSRQVLSVDDGGDDDDDDDDDDNNDDDDDTTDDDNNDYNA